MPKDKSFSVDGKVVDISADKVESFLKDTPNAVEVQTFVAGRKNYSIPINEVQSFLKDVPWAKPLKKKEQSVSSGGESTSTGANTGISEVKLPVADVQAQGITKKPETKPNTPAESDLSNERQSVRPDSYFPAPDRLTSKELGKIDKNLANTLYQHNLPNIKEPAGQTEGELNATQRREQASLQGAILSLEQQKQGMEFTGDDLTDYNPERVKVDKEIQAKREQLKAYKEPVDFFDRIPNSDKYAANKPEIQNYLKNMEVADPEGFKLLNQKAEKGLLSEHDYFSFVVDPALKTQMEIANQDYEILKNRGVVHNAQMAATIMRDMEELQVAIEANPQDEQLKATFMQKDEQLKTLQDPQIDELMNVIAKGDAVKQAYGEAILAMGKDIGLVQGSVTDITDDMPRNVLKQLDLNREYRKDLGSGSLKAFGESVAGVMDDIDKLGKFAAAQTGLGDILLDPDWEKRKGIAGQAATELRDKLVPLNDMPETWTGTMLSTAIPMATLIAEMAMFPEIRSARLARATGGVVKAIPAFTVMEGTLGGIREWDKLVKADNPDSFNVKLETLKGTAEGAAMGTGLHFLGAFGGETSKFVAKYVKGNFVPSASAFATTGTMFGTLDAFEQYLQTGKVDIGQSTAVGVGASVLSAPQVMMNLATDAYRKAYTHFSTSSKEVIQKAQQMPASAEELLKQAVELNKEGKENEANILNTMANVKMVAEDIVANPDKAKKDIEQSNLTDKEKEFFIDKVDQVLENAKVIEDQVLQDIKDGKIATFTFDKESDIPEVLKDKITSKTTINGKTTFRVSMSQTEADALLAKEPKPATEPAKPVEVEPVVKAEPPLAEKPIPASEKESEAATVREERTNEPTVQENLTVKPTQEEVSQVDDEGGVGVEAETFRLIENEGKWKATTKTYRGRETGNWVFGLLDKKQEREYKKIKDEADIYGTKEQAEANLKKLQDFEIKNKEAFVKAKEQIDNFKQREEKENKDKLDRQKIYDETANQLSELSDSDFEKLINLIDKDVKLTLEKRFGDRIERRPLFVHRISEDYHKAKADGSNLELVKAVEDLLNSAQKEKTDQVPDAGKEIKPPIGEQPMADSKVDAASPPAVSGKTIEPNKEVSASKSAAIKDVLTTPTHKYVKEMEAGMLLNEAKDKDLDKMMSDYEADDFQQMEVSGDMKLQMFKKLEDKGYVEDFGGDTYMLTPKGRDFIEKVNARLETRKAVKAGTDLFPEYSGIPEIEQKLKQITDEHPDTKAETIRTFATKTEAESKQLEPTVRAIVRKSKVAGSLKKEAIEKAIAEIDKVIEGGGTPKSKRRLSNKDFSDLVSTPELNDSNSTAIGWINEYVESLVGNDLSEGRTRISGISGDAAKISKVKGFSVEFRFYNPESKVDTRQTLTFKTEESAAKAVDKVYELQRERLLANEPKIPAKPEVKVVEQTKDIPQEKKDVSGEKVKKEPWEITREEYIEANIGKPSESALSKGKYYNPETRKYEKRDSVERSLSDKHYQLLEEAYINGKSTKKPLWAETLSEYEKRSGNDKSEHRITVEQALKSGKPVPPEVLKDYPDLMPKSEKQTIPDLQEALLNRKITKAEYDKKVEEIRKQPAEKDFYEKTIDVLDSMKIDTKDKMYDATLGIPIVAWNASIDIIKAGVKGGKVVADAIKEAIDYLKSKNINFDEAKYEAFYKDIFDKKEAELRKEVTDRLPEEFKAIETKFFGSPTPDEAGILAKKKGGVIGMANKILGLPQVAQEKIFAQAYDKMGDKVAIAAAKQAAERNGLARNSTAIIRGLVKNLTKTNEQVATAEAFAGMVKDKSVADAHKINELLHKYLGTDKEKYSRVNRVLDPDFYRERSREEFEKELREAEGDEAIDKMGADKIDTMYDEFRIAMDYDNRKELEFSDLTPDEQIVHDQLRFIYDFTHDVRFSIGQIDADTYIKNKGKYAARLYDTFEMPEDIGKEMKAAGIKMDLGGTQARSPVNLWKAGHIVEDPIYAASKRLMQAQVNKAIYDYSHYVFNQKDAVSKVEKSGYTKLQGRSYGKLNEKWVRNDYVEDFKGFFFSNAVLDGTYRIFKKIDSTGVVQFYKSLLTRWNPGVRMGNYTGGVVFANTLGINPLRFTANYHLFARGEIKEYGEYYRYLLGKGLLNSDYTKQDLVQSVKDLDNINNELAASGNPVAMMGKFKDWVNETYSRVDELGKIAAFKSLVDLGLTPEQALNRVANGFQNFKRVGKLYDIYSKTPLLGNRFGKFQGDLMRIIKTGVQTRPLNYAAFLGTLYGMGFVASYFSDETEEDKKIRESRVGAPKVKTPFLDIPLSFKVGGNELNIARFISPFYIYSTPDEDDIYQSLLRVMPYGLDFIDKTNNPDGKWGVFVAKNVKDPLLAPLAQWFVDSDFRGMPILDPKETKWEKSRITPTERNINALRFLGRSYVPYGSFGDDAIRAMMGETDYYGREKTTSQVALRFLGYNSQVWQDERYNNIVTGKIKKLSREFADNGAALHSLKKDFNSGDIKESQYVNRGNYLLRKNAELLSEVQKEAAKFPIRMSKLNSIEIMNKDIAPENIDRFLKFQANIYEMRYRNSLKKNED